NDPKQVTWTEPNVDALVNYLHIHHSEYQGGFKDATINGALEHLRGLPLQTIGKAKDLKSICNKWTNPRSTYVTICGYRLQSGFHWDNEKGANIYGVAKSTVFDEYPNAAMKKFHNTPWKYLSQMEDIMHAGGATGALAYRGAIGTSATQNIQ
ncbi:hypothetical protein V8E55_002325, partial [Tylopilus felleus]